jgi:hypothetical protein
MGGAGHEEIFRLKGKENQRTSTGGSNPHLLQNSAEAEKIVKLI